MSRRLRQSDGIVVGDQCRIAAPGFGDCRRRSPTCYGFLQRLSDRRIHAGPHQAAEPVHVGLEDTTGVRALHAIDIVRLMPRSVVANDVHAVDPLEKCRIDAPDHIGQYGVHQIVSSAR